MLPFFPFSLLSFWVLEHEGFSKSQDGVSGASPFFLFEALGSGATSWSGPAPVAAAEVSGSGEAGERCWPGGPSGGLWDEDKDSSLLLTDVDTDDLGLGTGS